MAYWLMKSEPESYSWEDLVRDGGTEWDGVRNNAAALNLRSMQPGDRALFYHSMSDKAAVGIMEIARTANKDVPEGNRVSVAVKPVEPLPRPVTLAAMKADDRLSGMATLRQSRLSVSPVREEEWSVLMELAGRSRES
jgi:predicted RNA-binding protein with PUA-like domain